MGASRFQGKVVVSSHNELSTMSNRSRTILGMDFLVGRQWREWVWAATKNTLLYFVQFLSRVTWTSMSNQSRTASIQWKTWRHILRVLWVQRQGQWEMHDFGVDEVAWSTSLVGEDVITRQYRGRWCHSQPKLYSCPIVDY